MSHRILRKKKILSGYFKFDDLNLGLTEAIKLSKQQLKLFYNVPHWLLFGLGLLLPCKDRFGPQCHLALYLSRHHPMSFFMLKFLTTLVLSFLCSNIFIGFLARIVLSHGAIYPLYLSSGHTMSFLMLRFSLTLVSLSFTQIFL